MFLRNAHSCVHCMCLGSSVIYVLPHSHLYLSHTQSLSLSLSLFSLSTTSHVELGSILELQPLASLTRHVPPLIKGDVGFLLPRDNILAASAPRGSPLEGSVGHSPVEACRVAKLCMRQNLHVVIFAGCTLHLQPRYCVNDLLSISHFFVT